MTHTKRTPIFARTFVRSPLASALAWLSLGAAACGPAEPTPPSTVAEPAAEPMAVAPAAAREPLAANPRSAELVLLPEACADVLGDPAQLIALSEAAWRDRNPELGYRYAALVRQLHPESPEVAQAFELTAPALPHLYTGARSDPRSKWLTSEPVFMFEWLADIYAAAGDVFPETETNLLLAGAPKSLRLLFEDHARRQPLLARHRLRFKMENGFVEYVALAP